MFLVCAHYETGKKESAGELWQRVVSAHAAAGLDLPPIWLHLADSPFPGALDRVARALPALAAGTRDEVITNGRPGWLAWADGKGVVPLEPLPGRGAPASPESTQALLDGIPKRFAVFDATVVLGPVAALDGVGGVDLPAGLRLDRPGTIEAPHVGLTSAWGSPRRQVSLCAAAVVAAPPPRGSLPALGAPGAALLGALGKVTRVDVTEIVDSAEQVRRAAVLAKGGALIAAFAAAWDPGALPHALQHAAEWRQQEGSLAKPVAAALKPFGYRKVAGAGGLGFTAYRRRTRGEHVLEVTTDRTPIGAELRVELSVMVPGVTLKWEWPAISRVPEHNQLYDDEACAMAAANLAVIVARWEAALVPELLALVGDGAAWFDPS